jgi:hypothetical protein
MEKFAVLRMRTDDEEELLVLHCGDFDSAEAAHSHAKFHKIQHQYPNYRWFVIPMEEVEI